jgi:transposase-like protein
MTRKRRQVRADFSTQIGRITAAAVAMYGEKNWLAPIARRLGIGRSTLYRYIKGNVGFRNVDRELLALLAAERSESYARANRIAGVELRLSNAVAAEAAANAGVE